MPRSKTGMTLLLSTALVLPVGARMAGWLNLPDEPVDVTMAKSGEELFGHEWTKNDPLSPGGDGLGPVFNEASCLACHRQGGAGGGGPNEHNVVTFTVRRRVALTDPRNPPAEQAERVEQGLLHAKAVSLSFRELPEHVDGRIRNLRITRGEPASQNTLAQRIQQPMPSCGPGDSRRQPSGIDVSQRNTPALFGARRIDSIPARVIIANERRQYVGSQLKPSDQEEFPVGRASRLPNGRVGRFGWKGQIATVADFVEAACANELGLGNPGSAQPAPLSKRDYSPPGLDLSQQQCDQITAFVRALPVPIEAAPFDDAHRQLTEAGREMFHEIGCAACHTPDVGDVQGIYSDLLLHRMGRELQGGGAYGEPPVPISPGNPLEGPLADEWRTPPLWGVADSAPYMHDGRANTLIDAINAHRGQAARTAREFSRAPQAKREMLISFLETLRAPNAN